jgi:hypothetical protein
MTGLDAARERLATRQAALTAALVAGAEPPPGFDPDLVAVARSALLNKRAGEVAHAWPELAAALAAQWRPTFRAWAAARPPAGSLRDGFDLARDLARDGRLPAAARAELRAREGYWHYDGTAPPRPRRLPTVTARYWLGVARVYLLTSRLASASSERVPGTK